MSEAPAPYAVEPAPAPDQPVAPTFGQILAALQARYPHSFPAQGAEPKPLKIGIHQELLARGLPDGVSKTQLRHWLRGYTANFRYRKALAKGGSRVDLDGNLCGEITPEQAEYAKLSLKGKKPKPAASANQYPVDAPLTPENTVPGKLEVTIKFNELPKPVQVQGGYKFGLNCDGRPVVVVIKPKLWNKLTAAAAEYPQWIAALTGKMGPNQGNGFVLEQPSLQVFEKKPKPVAGADADNKPLESTGTIPTPPPSAPLPVSAAPAASARAKLSLKR